MIERDRDRESVLCSIKQYLYFKYSIVYIFQTVDKL